jgi:hypothetical protein
LPINPAEDQELPPIKLTKQPPQQPPQPPQPPQQIKNKPPGQPAGSSAPQQPKPPENDPTGGEIHKNPLKKPLKP